MIRQWLFGGTDVEFEKSLNFYAGWRENILPYSYAPKCVTPGVTARGRSISISSIILYQLYEYIYSWTFIPIIFMLMLMLDLWPQAETPGVTHFGAYHRHPDGHFFLSYQDQTICQIVSNCAMMEPKKSASGRRLLESTSTPSATLRY